MNKEQAERILHNYHLGKATQAEKELVEQWLLHGADQGNDLTEEELLEDLLSIRQGLGFHQPEKRKIKLWKQVSVAASIILIAAVSVFIFRSNSQFNNPSTQAGQQLVYDKPAGKNTATLTLADGTTIQLDKQTGEIAKEAGIEIVNDGKGNLVYDLSIQKPEVENLNAFHTISTPRSGQYTIILPDGSKVWLNAASSLRFPVAFSKTLRQVELTGEGYFEVAKSKVKFKVVTGQTAVEVLGTHFNVHAYDQTHAVTLVEGSVKVSQGSLNKIIKPGDQALLSPENDIILKSAVDIETFTAWKDGMFQFNNTDLKDIMREIERWYDVDVDESVLPAKKFNGSIPRNVKLSEVLAMIELTSNLKFKIQGRSVVMIK
jgi:transmembrane sensor